MKSLQILHRHYLELLNSSRFLLREESELMYQNSVVNSLVNIYLISLLAQPLPFQIQIWYFCSWHFLHTTASDNTDGR